MGSYLLRFEAADFDNTVFDSQSISAVRGASFTFLFSSEKVKSFLKLKMPAMKVIYTGASQGAFTFEAEEGVAKALAKEVEAILKVSDLGGKEPTGCHEHMAYVVALVPFDKNKEADALHAAESICNVKKLQGAGFPLPEFDPEARNSGEGRDPRPAAKGEKKSAALIARENFGRKQRQLFYNRMIENDPGFDFTKTIEDMVRDAHSELPLSLASKVAVFYADGNKLNRHRKEAMKSGLQGLTEFSDELKLLQRGLMEKIVAWLGKDCSTGSNAAFYKGDARFETLMWGGDEVLFVMPSWLALDFASMFFEATQGWNIKGNDVTFSAGLVICNAKTPIRQAKSVASDMAELCKKGMKNFGQNALQVEVFESISMPDTDFETYRKNFFFGADPRIDDDKNPDDVEKPDLLTPQIIIGGQDIKAFIKKIYDLDVGDMPFPRSQIYKLLDVAAKQGVVAQSTALNKDVVDVLAKYLGRAGAETGFSLRDLEVLHPIDGSKASFAVNLAMIAMLWDYCDAVKKLEGKGAWA